MIDVSYVAIVVAAVAAMVVRSEARRHPCRRRAGKATVVAVIVSVGTERTLTTMATANEELAPGRVPPEARACAGQQ